LATSKKVVPATDEEIAELKKLFDKFATFGALDQMSVGADRIPPLLARIEAEQERYARLYDAVSDLPGDIDEFLSED